MIHWACDNEKQKGARRKKHVLLHQPRHGNVAVNTVTIVGEKFCGAADSWSLSNSVNLGKKTTTDACDNV